jgi:large subunit ribosomal protein L24
MAIKLKLKKGDTVIVIAGDQKGKQGKIVEIDKEATRAFVEGVNMVKKHSKPSAKYPQGGVVEIASSIHISNLMLLEGGKPTKVGRKVVDGKSVRVAKKTQTVIK